MTGNSSKLMANRTIRLEDSMCMNMCTSIHLEEMTVF